MSLLIQGNPAFQAVEQAMTSIGYAGDLLQKNYEYLDVISEASELRTIDLAGFAQTPPTYRNACIGVLVSNGFTGADEIARHKALGAPLVFEVTHNTLNRWKINARTAPELKERIPLEQIANAFKYNESSWQPESILRAKAVGESPTPMQLDFYDESFLPFLENRNFEKLDFVLREVLTKARRAYKQLIGRSPQFQELFPLAFRMLAAKVFRDRGYKGGWNSDDAMVALKAIEKHYNVGSEILPQSEIHSPEVLQRVWSIILSLFHFANLSEDDLALIFENTFITPTTRRRLGIHSTPPRVAQYIVQRLPLEEIPDEERYVLEPFAGHGRFLIAAMRRMRNLLSSPLTDAQRHQYFRDRLFGIEIDWFSVEVSRLSMMLADSPNPNHWQITRGDAFDSGNLAKALQRARIVLCNPPFENFEPAEREKISDPDLLIQKPAELLRRLLLHPPEMMGLVVPRRFESGIAYKRFHTELAKTYSSIELVALPEVFNYSDAVTTLIIASGHRTHSGYVAVKCQQIEKRQKEVSFESGTMTSTETVIGPSEYSQPNFSLWIPPLSSIWRYTGDYPQLSLALTQWHRGIQWKPATAERGKKVDKHVSVLPKNGYVKGFVRAEDKWQQYYLDLSALKYLSIRPQDQTRNSYKDPWERPKVVCNASRLSRSQWRVGAVVDERGFAFSSRFVLFWPEKNVSLYAVAALLNSPLSNAFLKAKESGSLNRLVTLGMLPIPSVECLHIGGKLDSLSRSMHAQMAKRSFETANDTLLHIDAEILRAYDLPPRLEYELLASFQDLPRPVAFEFTRYYPDNFDAYISLHELISPEFENARADRLLQRLTLVDDPEITKALAQL